MKDAALESVKLNLFDILQLSGDPESVAYHEPRITRMATRIIEDYERNKRNHNERIDEELINIPSEGDGY